MGKNKNKKNKNRNNSAENAEIQAIMQQTAVDKSEIAPVEAPAAIEKTERLSTLDDEIAKLRAQRMASLDEEIRCFRECQMKVVSETIASQIAANQQMLADQKKAALEELKSLRSEAKDQIEAQKTEAQKLEEIFETRQAELDARQAQLKAQSDEQTKREKSIAEREAAVAVRESGVDEKTAEAEASKMKSDKVREIYRAKINASNDDVEKRAQALIEEREKTFSSDLNAARAECERLRDELAQCKSDFDALRLKFGDDPQNVEAITAKYEATIAELRKRIGTVPAEEVIADRDRLSQENNGLNERNQKLQDELSRRRLEAGEILQLRAECEKCRAEAALAKSISQINIDAKAVVEQELEKLKAIYQPAKGANVRYAQIEAPYVTAKRVPRRPVEQGDRISENAWLTNIKAKSDEYGIVFNERILKAFHTALKTAEWSPLTILAGVSGTGKSELPRLYSHFGGIVFEPVPVQPNWDSQEAMLGYFNSIDNRFAAQPLLQFLAQSQKDWTEDYHGLRDAVCMVLLDEMNLVHPELYFAQFLSKLESRRGCTGDDVPILPIDAGAGVAKYQLELGRNVLWTGTMNQDETTQSLSDKVLDRSIVIHFPRPVTLKRRTMLNTLNDENRGELLHRADWESWWVKESIFGADDGNDPYQIGKYKRFVEKINLALGEAGRALGHRVWQSIEYYMSNYPDVLTAIRNGGSAADIDRAMHTAFEDQIVQKIMPKLRGIDTRGDFKRDCLDVILGYLNEGVEDPDGKSCVPFKLEKDFQLACKLGFGQFVWQSANYLNEEEKIVVEMPQQPSVIEVKPTEAAKPERAPVAPVQEKRTAQAPENNFGAAFDAAFGVGAKTNVDDGEKIARLRKMAVALGKNLNELTFLQIAHEFSCDGREAYRLRQLCKNA